MSKSPLDNFQFQIPNQGGNLGNNKANQRLANHMQSLAVAKTNI